MDTIVTILLALAGGAALTAFVLRRRTPGTPDPMWSELASMRAEMLEVAQRVSSDSSEVARRLEGIDQRMTVTQTASVELAKDIFERLGDVRRATTSVAEQAKEFSSLQDLLRTRTHGGLGEALLEELLRQLLPPHAYSMQHRFTSGSTVDAVVKVGGRIVCIDSKFPLANFRRMCDAPNDLERIDAERAFVADVREAHPRISRPGTWSRTKKPSTSAVMYVPAEGVYGELLRLTDRRRPLFETAIEARVVPMSPLTMSGYLQTILFGLKCLSIEKSAEAILDFCGRLQQDFERFESEYEVLGKHLGTPAPSTKRERVDSIASATSSTRRWISRTRVATSDPRPSRSSRTSLTPPSRRGSRRSLRPDRRRDRQLVRSRPC